jgi:PHD/YefM family antitoxin component YafN of YafNO toxin-antitoxin module
MIDTYNIRELQSKLTQVCRGRRKFVIANRNQPLFVALPIADYEAMIETLDVLNDPEARKAIRRARDGKVTYQTLDLDDENFGL